MYRKKKSIILYCLLFSFSLPGLVSAGGFQINSQGQKSFSMAGTFTGIGSDASSAFFNPGAMSFLKSSSITAGGFMLMPRTSYLSPLNGNVNMDDQSFISPHLYANFLINKELSVGVSLNSPFGLGTKWKDDWEGKYLAQETNIHSYFIQPAVSYALSESFSVGAGFIYAIGKADLTKAVFDNGGSIGTTKLEGDDNSFGYNIGLFFKFEDKARIGINYRSSVKFEIENGDATFSNIPSSLSTTFPASTTFSTTINLPSVLSLGVSYNFTENFLLGLDVNLTSWSVYDSLVFRFPEEYTQLNANSHYGRNSKDVIAIRMGAELKMNDQFTFRAGAAYDQTPVKEGYVTPELPDANKMIFTLGATYNFSDNFSADLTLAMESSIERKDTNIENGFSGTYKSVANIFGLGFNYKFGK